MTTKAVATDAEKLAERLAEISGRCSREQDRYTIIEAVGALRRPAPRPADAGAYSAEDMVEDLLQAAHDHEIFGSKGGYDKNLKQMKKKVIEALTAPVTTAGEPTADQIKHMVDRFLGWKLPSDFNPDDGISFEKVAGANGPYPFTREPSGTNLFDASQTDAMVRYMLEGLPSSPHASAERAKVVEEMRSTKMQAIGQAAIRNHPHYDGGPVSAYGFAGAVLKAVAAALSEAGTKP